MMMSFLPFGLSFLSLVSQAEAFSPHVPSSSSSNSADNRIRSSSSSRLGAFEVEAAVTPATASAPTSNIILTSIDTFFQTQPYMASFVVCSAKASAADLLAQQQGQTTNEESFSASDHQEEDEPLSSSPFSFLLKSKPQQLATEEVGSSNLTDSVDIPRNIGFLLYGGLYTGMAQNFIFTQLYPALFHDDDALILLIKTVALDNFVIGPLVCLPVAYAFKAAVASERFSTQVIQEGWTRYATDVLERGLLTKYWSIWVPVQFLTFGVVPSHFRVAFVAFVSFFWLALLSVVSSEESE